MELSIIFAQDIASRMINNMAITLSFSYLVMKIIIRHISKNIAKVPSDIWDVFSWFSVDIAFITLGYCIVRTPLTKIPTAYQSFVFIMLVFILIFNVLLYTGFIGRRRSIQKNPFSDWRLALNISLNYFASFYWFYLVFKNF